MPADRFDVVVIGAGAAGLFCAAVAAKRGRQVLLLEHGADAGAKNNKEQTALSLATDRGYDLFVALLHG